MISHLKWMGHSATIFEIQKSLREDLQSCEVTLVAKDYSVRAHRFILSSCSDLLRILLVDIPLGQEATIVVPDIKGALLDSVLAFIYMGEAQISSSNLSDFLEAINVLGIKSAISFECNTLSRPHQPQNQNTNPIKSIAGLEIVQEDIIESGNVPISKIHAENVAPAEFLEMYGDSQPKIHYALEQIPGTNHGNEFILTENAGEYTLTPNTKIGTSVNDNSSKLDTLEVGETEAEVDGEADEESMIEELSSNAGENIMEMGTETSTNVTTNPLGAVVVATDHIENAQTIESKTSLRSVKIKETTQHHESHEQQEHHLQDETQEQQYENNEPVESKNFTIYESKIAVKVPLSCKSETTSDPLEQAVQSVLYGGMSLQKAAQKHDISKTVLWRRVRKYPNYNKNARENPVVAAACERLKDGESMKNICKELDIPMSTLHRHKVRLSLQGRLPKWVTFKKRDAGSKDELREKLNKAVYACVHDGMSQNHAANLFDIPKSTLWRHLQKRMAEAAAMVDEIKEEVILS